MPRFVKLCLRSTTSSDTEWIQWTRRNISLKSRQPLHSEELWFRIFGPDSSSPSLVCLRWSWFLVFCSRYWHPVFGLGLLRDCRIGLCHVHFRQWLHVLGPRRSCLLIPHLRPRAVAPRPQPYLSPRRPLSCPFPQTQAERLPVLSLLRLDSLPPPTQWSWFLVFGLGLLGGCPRRPLSPSNFSSTICCSFSQITWPMLHKRKTRNPYLFVLSFVFWVNLSALFGSKPVAYLIAAPKWI